MRINRYIIWTIVCITVVGILALAGILSSDSVSKNIMINEICSNNFSVVYDENYNYIDYIELYNPSSRKVSLNGYILSDSLEKTKWCMLDGMEIEPYGYALVFADGAEESKIGHVGFKISKQGETVYLRKEDGEIIDYVVVPDLSYNTCYARVTDGNSEWWQTEPTPKKMNNGTAEVKRPNRRPPQFNYDSGFYDEPIEVKLSARSGDVIYYTLDGSEPTTGSLKYQNSIWVDDASQNLNIYSGRNDLQAPQTEYVPEEKVDKATIIRAIAYCEETGDFSEVETRTYFIGYENKKGYDGIPVMSIVSSPEDLFDSEYGIYVNGKTLEEYKQNGGLSENGELLSEYMDTEGNIHVLWTASNAFNRGKEWEREATISYFNSAHEYEFTQDVGVRITGASSRGFTQKSFNIYARDIYDNNDKIEYEFFENKEYSSIKLRNGGNDNLYSKIKDAFMHSLVRKRSVSTQDSMPCIVFLNGEYWGIYNMRERYTEDYFWNYFGIDEDNVWMMKGGVVNYGGQETFIAYKEMLQFADDNDMADMNNYVRMCELIDMQSFIDYYCINLYINNIDVGFDKNIALWRTVVTNTGNRNQYGDGRWRWMLYDLDTTCENYKNNTFSDSVWWVEGLSLMDEVLIKNLIRNPEFRKRFCLTFMDIANTNFAYDNVHEQLVGWADTYREPVSKNHQRFLISDIDEDYFNSQIQEIDNFFLNRFDYITAFMAEELELDGTREEVKILSNMEDAGTISVNTALIDLEKEWKGMYYTDYPISISATAKKGYRFCGWKGDIVSEQETVELIVPAGGITLQAEFEKIR